MTRGLRTIGLVVGILGVAAAVSRADASKAIREAIKNLQKSKNVEDRVEAARYLGGFDDAGAVQALAEALSDRDAYVQGAAASALWHTGAKALAAGAKIDLRNQSNMNALEGAVFSGNAGVEELIAAGARLDAQKAKAYLEAYKDDPKAVALIRKAAVK